MHGGADDHRPSAATLVPMAFVAVVVLVVALVVSGGRRGTIVIQTLTEHFAAKARTGRGPLAISFTSIAETSASGALERLLTATSLAPGVDSVVAGNLMQVYLPSDNTIFVITQGALAPTQPGNHQRVVGQRKRPITISYEGSWLAPGRRSFFATQLHRHNYRVAGRTTIDGRQALRLVPVHTSVAFATHSGAQMLLEPAFVTPGTYQPIEESLPGFGRTVWSEYRVLPNTANNQRLLSLTARHPAAHISDSVTAYFAAVRKLK